jgi:hypothetical protein
MNKQSIILVEQDFEVVGNKFYTGEALKIKRVYPDKITNMNRFVLEKEVDLTEDDLFSLEYQNFIKLI